MAKKYTVMIIPNISGNPKSFSISANLWKGLIATSLVFVTLLSFITYRQIVLNREVAELGALKLEAKEQHQKIKLFAQKIKNFNENMSELAVFDKKLRLITSLGIGQYQASYSIGGSLDNDALENSAPETRGELMSMLENGMDKLGSNANIQLKSFKEIDSFFKEQNTLLSSTPSIWPIRGWVTSGFGYRLSPFTGRKEMHEGLDIATKQGAPVTATADGIVVRVGKDASYGNLVEIDHGYGVVTRFGHNAEILVSIGEFVKRGQKVTTVGNTGRSTGPHLHYEVILNGIPVNPSQYIIN